MLGFESTEIVWNGQRSVEIRMKEKELNLKEAKVTSSVIRKANDTTDYYIHAFKGEDDLVLEATQQRSSPEEPFGLLS